MIYLFEAIDNENSIYELWAHSFNEAETKLKQRSPEKDFIVYPAYGLPKFLSYEFIKRYQDNPQIVQEINFLIAEEVYGYTREEAINYDPFK